MYIKIQVDMTKFSAALACSSAIFFANFSTFARFESRMIATAPALAPDSRSSAFLANP